MKLSSIKHHGSCELRVSYDLSNEIIGDGEATLLIKPLLGSSQWLPLTATTASAAFTVSQQCSRIEGIRPLFFCQLFDQLGISLK